MSGRFANRIAVVTGASRGLGFELAKQLGTQGAQVVAIARTVGGLEELDDAIQAAGGPAAALVPLDLGAGHDQLDALGATLHQRFGRVDMLVHSAAMLGALGPLTHQDPAQFQRVLMVNCTAAWRLLRSLDALLRQSPNVDVILPDCDLGDDTTAYWGPYRASKAALRTLAHTFAREMQQHGTITVHTPLPAAMPTKLHTAAFPGIDAANLSTAQAEAAKILASL